MFKLATIFLCFASSDSIPPKQVVKDSMQSVVFVPKIDLKQVPRIPYQHQQGFFCDFEDKMNANRKLLLNIGVGDQ